MIRRRRFPVSDEREAIAIMWRLVAIEFEDLMPITAAHFTLGGR
jgi:hypothetical protein